MKILHICTDLNIGGAGIWILNLLKYADRTQFEHAVVLPEGAQLAPRISQEQIQVIEAPIAEKSLDIQAISALCRVISAFDPDIVHTHGSLSGRIAARLKGRKVVVTRHWVDLPDSAKKHGFKTSLAGRINTGLADIFIATAQAVAENLRESGIRADKIRVIPNGAPPVERLTDAQIEAARARIGISGFTVGMLARLEAVKGHLYLLEAAKTLKAQGRIFHVLIAGTGSLEAELKEVTKALALEEQITFLGFYENPGEFLNLIDLQVNASYTETTCLALLEGMSIGVVAVASDGGGNQEVITDGKNGLVFPAADSEALAEAIGRLMDDPVLRRDMSQQAVQIYQEKFTAEVFAKQVEQVYQEV